MSKNVNGVLLKHLFQLAEEDKQNERIEELLDSTISEMKAIDHNTLSIKYNNGVDVVITHLFDMYHIYISDSKLYMNEETAYSPMGSDRVLYYLKQIAHFKYTPRFKEGKG